jgi:hypothetical protein
VAETLRDAEASGRARAVTDAASTAQSSESFDGERRREAVRRRSRSALVGISPFNTPIKIEVVPTEIRHRVVNALGDLVQDRPPHCIAELAGGGAKAAVAREFRRGSR